MPLVPDGRSNPVVVVNCCARGVRSGTRPSRGGVGGSAVSVGHSAKVLLQDCAHFEADKLAGEKSNLFSLIFKNLPVAAHDGVVFFLAFLAQL